MLCSQVSEQQFPELMFIWKEIKSSRPVVAIASADVIVGFVKQGLLEAGSVLSSFLASASQIHCPQGIFNLLV
jgi:hypothetical protein